MIPVVAGVFLLVFVGCVRGVEMKEGAGKGCWRLFGGGAWAGEWRMENWGKLFCVLA